jgi:hypothetical protein
MQIAKKAKTKDKIIIDGKKENKTGLLVAVDNKHLVH